MVLYADVLLPLSLPQRYTYAVSIDLADFVQVGHRVIVQFGRNKFYAAIITELHHRKPSFAPKLIETIADELPIVHAWQIDFWKWIAEYYLSTEGEVMNAALPIGLKLNSETLIVLNEYYEGDFESISSDAFVIVQMLRAQPSVTLSQIQSTLNKKNVYANLKELFSLGIAFGEEKITTRYQPKKETYVTLHDEYDVEENMKVLFDELTRAPKQLQLLMSYLNLAKKNTHIRKKELLESSGASASIFTALVEKNVFLPYQAEVSRLGTFIKTKFDNIQLTTEQQQAFESIKESFKQDKPALLFGVTGSGKTEIYTRLIAEKIAEGKQCLYLLPEIALTAQIINRLKGHFGEKLGVYHSKFNDHEKVEIWNKVLNGEYDVIVAVRSGIFFTLQKTRIDRSGRRARLFFQTNRPCSSLSCARLGHCISENTSSKCAIGVSHSLSRIVSQYRN
jgi:primosomal protein N' (replication factor Y)